jgi:hypothetical protein
MTSAGDMSASGTYRDLYERSVTFPNEDPMTHQPARTTLHFVCTGEFGMECARAEEGHSLHPMRKRLAAATPSKWADAIVVSVSEDGWIELVSVETAATTRVWHHEQVGETLHIGEPVALHATYNVLAVGSDWRSVVTESEPAHLPEPAYLPEFGDSAR